MAFEDVLRQLITDATNDWRETSMASEAPSPERVFDYECFVAVRVGVAFEQVGWDCAWTAGLCMCTPDIAEKCGKRPIADHEPEEPRPVFVFRGDYQETK